MQPVDDVLRVLRLPDDRALQVYAMPPASGWTLLFHGPTPSAPGRLALLETAATARGIRLVQYARPGYAGSDRVPGRSVADCVPEIAAILDDLGVERCLTLGWSGGGPHALACAALLPERVAAAGTIAGIAPYEAEGLDWLAGMGAANVADFDAAVVGPAALQACLEEQAVGLASATADDVATELGDLVSVEDRAVLTGEFAEFMASGWHRAVSTGIWGWCDDNLAFVRPWGFDLTTIRVPVTVWQGEHDRMVPSAHGEWLAAHIPGARANVLPDHGHLSLVAAAFGQILDDLLERAAER